MVKHNVENIKHVHITTQLPAIKIIDKKGPLRNPADRDHCLQYMVAVGLLFGCLTAEHYENSFAESNPTIDELRDKMIVTENVRYQSTTPISLLISHVYRVLAHIFEQLLESSRTIDS